MLVADHASLSSGMRGNQHAAGRVFARLPAAQLSLKLVSRTKHSSYVSTQNAAGGVPWIIVFQAILAIIRLLIDPDLRAAVATVRAAAGESSEAWAKQIKRSCARFRIDEKLQGLAFGDSVHRHLHDVNLSEKAIGRFEIVFMELVENAFRHGGRGRRRGKVTITIDYSQWFIKLRISDPGAGFPFEEYRTSPKYERHGLGIVSRLAKQFGANPKGNVVTATLLSNDEVTVNVNPEADDTSILSVRVSNQQLWHYSEASWEPLYEIIDRSGKNLVLIDCRSIRWSSSATRLGPSKLLAAFESRPDYRLAFVVSDEAVRIFDFTHLDSRNSRVFRDSQFDAAKRWLLLDK